MSRHTQTVVDPLTRLATGAFEPFDVQTQLPESTPVDLCTVRHHEYQQQSSTVRGSIGGGNGVRRRQDQTAEKTALDKERRAEL